MENPPWIFFMFLAITGVVFLKLGFIVFDKTDLPNSISPPIISLFKHLLAISVCHSSNYALIFRPLKPFPVHKYSLRLILAHAALLFYRTGTVNPFAFNSFFHYLLHFFVVTTYSVFKIYFQSYFAYAFTASLIPLVYSSGSDSFAWYLAICVWINLLGIVVQRPILVSGFNNKMIIAIFFNVESSLFLIGGTTNKSSLFPTFFVLLVSYTTTALCSADKSFVDLFSVLSGNDKKVRLLRFGVGVVGAALFQNSVALTSFAHVAAFLCFAVAWLANLVMLRASFDFGIFEFLLGNVIVGCAVSRFGLHAPTWLFYGASVILYGLRLKLESVTMARREALDLIRDRNLQMLTDSCLEGQFSNDDGTELVRLASRSHCEAVHI